MTCSPYVTARVRAGLRSSELEDQPEITSVARLYGDLETVLDERASLSPAETPEVGARLHIALPAVLRLARPLASADVIATAQLLAQGPVPVELGHLRRLAMATSDLLDPLLDELP